MNFLVAKATVLQLAYHRIKKYRGGKILIIALLRIIRSRRIVNYMCKKTVSARAISRFALQPGRETVKASITIGGERG